MIFSELKRIIDNNNSFLISTHISPDGDCIGSELALYWYLISAGKEAFIFNSDPVPQKFCFLANSNKIYSSKPSKTFDVLIVLDCSNPERLGWNGYETIAQEYVNIDHHRDNTLFGTINIVQDSAAATAQILYEFFKNYVPDYPAYVAEALFTAIMSDTGGFRFSNTTKEVLKICADLAFKGADCPKISKEVFGSLSIQALKLQARIWSTLQFHCEGRVCTMEMPFSFLEETGATYADSEGMAEYTMIARGVEVGILIKYRQNETHFSLRSNGNIDVGKLAQKIQGGGGHVNAAGCTLYESKEKAMAKILELIRKELN